MGIGLAALLVGVNLRRTRELANGGHATSSVARHECLIGAMLSIRLTDGVARRRANQRTVSV